MNLTGFTLNYNGITASYPSFLLYEYQELGPDSTQSILYITTAANTHEHVILLLFPLPALPSQPTY